jgi:hypothetical protein
MTRSIRYGLVAVLVAALAGLTACGGGNGVRSASGSPSAANAMSDDQIIAIVREYAQCLRDHGIANVQEVRLVNHKLEGEWVPGDHTNDASMHAAEEACDAIRLKLPSSVWAGQEDPPTAEELAKMGQFSQCLRQHGFPDWPDPKGDGTFPLSDSQIAVLKSDSFLDARKACQQYYQGEIGPSKR